VNVLEFSTEPRRLKKTRTGYADFVLSIFVIGHDLVEP
jgi:hypothetical protein